MKIRIASTLLALALPLVAQETDAASQVEATFYKAYYLEKGTRDFDGAMALYAAFLAKAPEHKLAAEAAKQQFRLLDRTGKTAERDAFKAKYAKLLGNLANATTRPARGEGDAGGRGARPERGGERGQRGQRGGSRGGSIFGLMRNETKVADMTKEQIEEIKTGLESAGSMIDRMRDMMGDEVADKLEKASGDLMKSLEEGKMEDAQKALDALKEAFPMRGRGGRGGRGGEEGGRGGRGGRGGEEGGRGGRGGEEGGGGGRGGRGGRGGEEGGGGGQEGGGGGGGR